MSPLPAANVSETNVGEAVRRCLGLTSVSCVLRGSQGSVDLSYHIGLAFQDSPEINSLIPTDAFPHPHKVQEMHFIIPTDAFHHPHKVQEMLSLIPSSPQGCNP